MEPFFGRIGVTARRLLRTPAFTSIAVLTLAVGIGSNTAIFTVVDAVLLRPLPFDEPERLVGVWHTAPGLGFDLVNQSPALHFYYADHARSFESVGMWDNGGATVSGVAEPEMVTTMHVTHETLPLLGVTPAIGRSFTPEEDTPDGPQTVLLAHGYWERRFGGDREVLGRTLTVNGIDREVIGVLPARLDFLGNEADLYLPFRFDRSSVFVGNFSYQGVGRLAPGVTLAQANAEVERLVPLAVDAYPGGITRGALEQAEFGPSVRPLKEDVVGDIGDVLWVLLGTVGIVLLIACANVANLFLVRSEARHRELAVRAALGAGRRRISGELLLESGLLGIMGGLAGLILAAGGLALLVRLGPDSVPRLEEIGLGSTSLAFTVGVSLAAGLLLGILPVTKFGGIDLAHALKEGGRGGSSGKERHAARNGLVVAQVALALVLLTGSGLMVRSFQALRAVEPGFRDAERILTFRVTLPSAEVEALDQVALTHRDMLRRVEALPGVESAALTSSVTMDGWDSNDALESEANPVTGDRLPPIRRYKFIGPGYFGTMGNPLRAGRDLTWADVDDRARVVVVSEALAVAEWASPADALGQRVRGFLGEQGAAPWYEVVGVAGDDRDDGLAADPPATVYWPQVTEDFWGTEGPFTQRSMAFVVRTTHDRPTELLPSVREAIWSVNPNVPLALVRTVDELARNSLSQTSFTLVMLGIAASVALFLGLVGIYGVISYIVAQRTREIGVRMAIGARAENISGMVLKQASALTIVGVAIGLVSSFGLTGLMSSLLYGVEPNDPATLVGVSLLLAAVALGASWLPARRAASVDPVEALKGEG